MSELFDEDMEFYLMISPHPLVDEKGNFRVPTYDGLELDILKITDKVFLHKTYERVFGGVGRILEDSKNKHVYFVGIKPFSPSSSHPTQKWLTALSIVLGVDMYLMWGMDGDKVIELMGEYKEQLQRTNKKSLPK